MMISHHLANIILWNKLVSFIGKLKKSLMKMYQDLDGILQNILIHI
jgi:hypothetical protein